MPKTQELLDFLQAEDHIGVLLMMQLGGTPEELNLIVQTAWVDAEANGLRDGQAYIMRLLGVKEHRASLGMFGNLFIAAQHPILYHHNAARYAIDFKGTPTDANELVLDIQAAYSATFGPWRDLAEDINRQQPLFDLLQSGEGQLGIMPEPAARRMVKVFEHHGMTSKLEQTDSARPSTQDDDKAAQFETELKLVGLDDSYFVVYSVVVDEMNIKAR